jgi:hypothetical protein
VGGCRGFDEIREEHCDDFAFFAADSADSRTARRAVPDLAG